MGSTQPINAKNHAEIFFLVGYDFALPPSPKKKKAGLQERKRLLGGLEVLGPSGLAIC